MIKTINETEITKLLSHAKYKSIRNYTMIFLALSTGIRVSELIGLFIEDVAPYGDISRFLTIPSRIGKNGKVREIPINQETRDVIHDFMKIKVIRQEFTNSDSFLFVSNHTRNPLSSRDFQRIVHDISSSSIGRSITPHVLRHTFATRLLRHTNIRVVQETLGHSSVQTTQIYTHVNSEEVSNAIDNFKLPQ